ncbi:Glyoxalase domain-containing protein 4 [Hypsibius exemplaris]|uniref:Glyoxalase domain-containing protein 4 n=1 Tax=Hypsibius exemplaris TaxID=2072580 RepID=A0A1W0XBB8_HYPEX|nr:Glyoxalase domain-containing protein 4 [Hypsibius exemplaris]
MEGRRPLHYVFKLAEREKTIKFYTEILGMKVLRHEEFEGGCAATCNGPYDNAWSKTMVGYGSEDDHVVIELTYNYGINSYELGNDFLLLTIKLPGVKEKLDAAKFAYEEYKGGRVLVRLPYSPGYQFEIINEQAEADPVQQVTLASSDIVQTIEFWQILLGMSIVDRNDTEVTLKYNACPFTLRFLNDGRPVKHSTAQGRMAIAAPEKDLLPIQEVVNSAGYQIKTPLISLDTPGKATVEVVVLLDPDHHEVAFVGDEACRELSQFDPKAADLLDAAIKADKSLDYKKKF